MHFLTLTAAFFGLSVYAQSMAKLPECARACVGENYGNCNAIDINCICSNKNWLKGLACCISSACNEKEQKETIEFASNICKSAQVEIPKEIKCDSSEMASVTAARTITVTATRTGGNNPTSSSFAGAPKRADMMGYVVAGLAALL